MAKLFVNSLGEILLDEIIVQLNDLHRVHQRLVRQTWRIQDKLSDGRFRFYLSGHSLWLTTEFIAFMDETHSWKDIRTACKDVGGKMFTLHEHPHTNRTKTGNGPWINGPNHGRMEKQVSIDLPIKPMTIRQAQKQLHKLRKGTETIWNAHGVSVI